MNANQIYDVISQIFQIYWILLIIYILSSWIPPLRFSKVGEVISRLCEPYLTPFRKIIPPIGGVLDLSPIVALIALDFIELGLLSAIDMLIT